MSFSRSKSALDVSSSATRDSRARSHLHHQRPDLSRIHSAIETAASFHVPPTTIPSPLVERQEDPFNLSNFFPADLAYTGREETREWNWLQKLDDDSEGVWTDRHALFDQQLTEDGLPPTPPDNGLEQDEQTENILMSEDKLGILGWTHFLTARHDSAIFAVDYVLSPYHEDGPTDDEGLYHSLLALREVRDAPPRGRGPQTVVSSTNLFSPLDEDLEKRAYNGREWFVYWGVSKAIDLFESRLR